MCVYRWIVLNDDVWGQDLRDYVRSESVKKGQKNMTVESFRKFVNTTIIPEVIKRGEGNGLPQSVATNGVSSKTARFVIIYLFIYVYNYFFKLGFGCITLAVILNKARRTFTMMGMKGKMLYSTEKNLFQGS